MKATAVGNYPKVGDTYDEQKLRRALARRDSEDIMEEELARVQREVTLEVLSEQEKAGLDLLTDGQIGWDDPQTAFARRLDGFEINGLLRYFDSNTYYRQPVVTGEVRWKESIAVDAWSFAAEHTSLPVKAVLTGPTTLARLSKDTHYGKQARLIGDVAEALRREAKALRAAGATFIQIDEPALTLADVPWEVSAAAVETVAAGASGATVCLMTYFGSMAKHYPHLLDLPVDVIGLDFVQGPDNATAVAEQMTEKALALGLIDARNTRLEDPAKIVRRLEPLVENFNAESSYVNPSCGLEFLPRETARKKLAIVTQTARLFREVV